MRRQMQSRHRARGVTLMELMTVVAVIGILSAIAIPGYGAYMRRVKRTDAKTEMLAVAQRLERCYTRFNAYNNGGCTVAGPVLAPAGATGTRVTYSIAVVYGAGGQSYELTATPQNGQAGDAKCGNFRLNNLGQRDATGTMGPQPCWAGSGG